MTNVLIGKFGKYISFDSKKWEKVENKFEKYFSEKSGK